MIRFSAIVSVVVVALGLLIAGALSGTLMLVYLAISVACLALLLLIVGVVVWRDDVFGRPADHDAPVVGQYGGEEYLAPARQAVPAGVAVAASAAALPADVPVPAPAPGRRGRQVQPDDTYEHPGRRRPDYRDRPEAPGRREAQPPPAAREDLTPARSRTDESRREELRRDEFRRDERRREQPRPDERGGRPDPAREHPAIQPVAASAGFGTTAGPATAESAAPDGARRRRGDETGRPIANQPAAPAQQDPLARPDPFAGRPEPRTGRSEATPGLVEPGPGRPEPGPGRPEPGPGRPEPGPGRPESRPGRQSPPAGQAEQPFASPAATRSAPASGQAGPAAAAAPDALRGSGPERQPEPPQGSAQRESQPTSRPADPIADRDPATRQSTQLTPVVRSAKPASPAGGRPDEAPGSEAAGPAVPPAPAQAGSPDRVGSPDRASTPPQAGSSDRASTPPQAGSPDRAGAPPPPAIPRPASATADTSAISGANATSAPAGPGQAGNSAPGLEVTVVPGIARYHKADCILIRFLGEEDLEKMPIGKAEESGCVACRACRPDKELATT